jgi:hypothetical protein
MVSDGFLVLYRCLFLLSNGFLIITQWILWGEKGKKMIPEAILSSLKENLKDVTVKVEGEDVKLFKYITASKTGLYDRAEAADKIKATNEDLISQRDTWKTEKQSLEDKVKAAEESVKTKDGEINKIKESQLTEDERKQYIKLKETGMSDDTKAKLTTMEAELKKANDNIATLTNNWEEEKKKTKDASLSGAKQGQDNKLLTELAKHKIEGPRADTALAVIRSKGYAKLEDNDAGVLTEKYRVFVDGGEGESTLSKMVEAFAKENDYLVSGTGNGGTGANHSPQGGGGGDTRPTGLQMLKAEKDGFD